jgi:SAM-dependent methyltransferase
VSATPTYREYVSNKEHMREYSEYQKRYATQVRESDKVLIELVHGLVQEHAGADGSPALLDIGCSTGNLLRHLKYLVPGVTLWGGDLAREVVEACQQDPELAGIHFAEMNAVELGLEGRFNLVVANAILGALGEAECDRTLASVARALRGRGWLLAFDWFSPFEQELTVVERSRAFPGGLTWSVRSYTRMKKALAEAGFGPPRFLPFYMPIDLPRPEDAASVRSYTVPTADGKRLSFRGAFCQPWCHLVVQKAG